MKKYFFFSFFLLLFLSSQIALGLAVDEVWIVEQTLPFTDSAEFNEVAYYTNESLAVRNSSMSFLDYQPYDEYYNHQSEIQNLSIMDIFDTSIERDVRVLNMSAYEGQNSVEAKFRVDSSVRMNATKASAVFSVDSIYIRFVSLRFYTTIRTYEFKLGLGQYQNTFYVDTIFLNEFDTLGVEESKLLRVVNFSFYILETLHFSVECNLTHVVIQLININRNTSLFETFETIYNPTNYDDFLHEYMVFNATAIINGGYEPPKVYLQTIDSNCGIQRYFESGWQISDPYDEELVGYIADSTMYINRSLLYYDSYVGTQSIALTQSLGVDQITKDISEFFITSEIDYPLGIRSGIAYTSENTFNLTREDYIFYNVAFVIYAISVNNSQINFTIFDISDNYLNFTILMDFSLEDRFRVIQNYTDGVDYIDFVFDYRKYAYEVPFSMAVYHLPPMSNEQPPFFGHKLAITYRYGHYSNFFFWSRDLPLAENYIVKMNATYPPTSIAKISEHKTIAITDYSAFNPSRQIRSVVYRATTQYDNSFIVPNLNGNITFPKVLYARVDFKTFNINSGNITFSEGLFFNAPSYQYINPLGSTTLGLSLLRFESDDKTFIYRINTYCEGFIDSEDSTLNLSGTLYLTYRFYLTLPPDSIFDLIIKMVAPLITFFIFPQIFSKKWGAKGVALGIVLAGFISGFLVEVPYNFLIAIISILVAVFIVKKEKVLAL